MEDIVIVAAEREPRRDWAGAMNTEPNRDSISPDRPAFGSPDASTNRNEEKITCPRHHF